MASGQVGARRAKPDDHARLARTLAAAFVDDPAWSWLMPFADREQRQRLYFETELAHQAHRRQVWVAENGAATAVWAPPGLWRAPLGISIREAPAMFRVFGRRLPLAFFWLLRAEHKHPRRPDHWYLQYLGTEPNRQGHGLGSALLRPMLALCDRDRTGAYLESSSDRSRALYERHGFEVVETFPMPGGGPDIHRMWRDPRR